MRHSSNITFSLNSFPPCSSRIKSFLVYFSKVTEHNIFNISHTGLYAFEADHQIRSDQSLSLLRLFATPWIAAHQASPSITNSRSSPRFTSIESVMPSSHLILCRPLFLLPPISHSIRVFSNELPLHIRWPEYWSFHYSIRPFNGSRYWCIGGRIRTGHVNAS